MLGNKWLIRSMQNSNLSRISLVHHIGRRGSFLLFLSLLDLIYSFSLAFPSPTAVKGSSLLFLASIFPLDIWALLWGLVGLNCLIFAFKSRDAPGFASAMFLKVLWALTFLLGWIFAGVERGYLSTAIWGAFAAVLWLVSTWPESGRSEEMLS